MTRLILRSALAAALLFVSAALQAAQRPDWYPSDDVVAARTKAFEERQKAALAYYEREYIQQYKTVGHRDPKWDDTAYGLMRATIADRVDTTPDATPMRLMAANKCVQTQPQDPFIVFLYARTMPGTSAGGAAYRDALGQACDGLTTSGYLRTIRFYGLLRQAELAATATKPDMAVAEDRLAQALEQVEYITKDKDIPSYEIRGLMDSTQDVSIAIYKDRWKLTSQLYAALTEKLGERADLLAAKGRLFTNYAWDARGNGWASTVTDEGWRLMKERLAVAEADLNAAWKIDPQYAPTAAAMIGVELGQGKGTDVMEMWFRRAVAAAPYDPVAYEAKRYYLEGKWHGSDEEMLQFAREVCETVPKTSPLRMIIWKAHETLASVPGKEVASVEAEYFRAHPDAWPEIKAVADDLVFAPKASNHCKAEFARVAVNAGDLPTARKYLAVTDEQLAIAEYGTEYYRVKSAAEQGK